MDFLATTYASSVLVSKIQLETWFWAKFAVLCVTRHHAVLLCYLHKETLRNMSLQIKGVMDLVCSNQFNWLNSARPSPVSFS